MQQEREKEDSIEFCRVRVRLSCTRGLECSRSIDSHIREGQTRLNDSQVNIDF